MCFGETFFYYLKYFRKIKYKTKNILNNKRKTTCKTSRRPIKSHLANSNQNRNKHFDRLDVCKTWYLNNNSDSFRLHSDVNMRNEHTRVMGIGHRRCRIGLIFLFCLPDSLFSKRLRFVLCSKFQIYHNKKKNNMNEWTELIGNTHNTNSVSVATESNNRSIDNIYSLNISLSWSFFFLSVLRSVISNVNILTSFILSEARNDILYEKIIKIRLNVRNWKRNAIVRHWTPLDHIYLCDDEPFENGTIIIIEWKKENFQICRLADPKCKV